MHPRHASFACSAGRKALIDHSLFNAAVRVDSAIPQEWPMRPLLVDASPIDLRPHNLFLIDRPFRDDFAVRSAHEALPPKFNTVSTGGRFVAGAVRPRDVAAIGDRVSTLNCLPRGMLRFSKFLFLARMPADCRWIKNNLRAMQGSQPRGFWIPLVPAHADTELAACCVPRLESKIARREIKFFVVQGIIGNMHFAIFTKQFSVRVDDCRGVVIKTRAASLEKRCND